MAHGFIGVGPENVQSPRNLLHYSTILTLIKFLFPGPLNTVLLQLRFILSHPACLCLLDDLVIGPRRLFVGPTQYFSYLTLGNLIKFSFSALF